MTREELERTKWAKDFRNYDGVSYEQAIELALDPRLCVVISHTNESGEWLWAIDAGDLAPEFWLDAKRTEKAARELCRKMGWKIQT